MNELRRVTLSGSISTPAGIRLPAAWQAYCAGREQDLALYRVQARALPEVIGDLRRRAGVTVKVLEAAPGAAGRQRIELAFGSFEAARQHLMGLGRGVEVLAPDPLRLGMIDFARQIIRRYAVEDEAVEREENP